VSGEQAVLATAKMAPPEIPKPASEIIEPLRAATAGDYDIAGELGRGGMATVFLAHDIALDRKVAIKVMTPSLVTGQGMVERFKREARTAASLSHPHIIPIFAVREMDQLLFFVMKYVDGRSLDTVIREQGPLPIPLVQAIMAQVGGALGYAHRRGIVHRDMKPANIMLDDEGWAVVTDFGIAKVSDARGLTMTGVTIGTPSYMSPEQCASKEITGATDQYSLGIVAFELLTGRVPFDADSLMGIMWKHFNEPPPPVRELRPDCPPHVADAIARMLAKDPNTRWPTMEDAVAAIGQPPMAPGDPIRKQMRALARGGTGAELQEHVHTPASPIPSTSAPTPPPAPPTPPPTPAPSWPSGPAPSPAADIPTVLTGDVSSQRTGGGAYVTDEGATVVTPQQTAPRAAPTSPPTPPPTADWQRPSAETAPTPRRRNLLLALGLPVVAVASAAAVWLALSLRSGGGTGADSTSVLLEPPVPEAPPPAPVARLTLNPESQTMAVGTSGELLAFLVDSTNMVLSDRTVAWESSDPSIVTVQAGLGVGGIVNALKAGTARIIATSEGHADTATVTVKATRAAVASVGVRLQTTELAPGDTVGVVTLVQDADGGNLGGRSVDLQSSDQAVIRIAGTRLIALAPGRANITAESEGVRSQPTAVTVRVPPVQSVAIQGPRTGLEQGNSARLGLQVLDARNRVVDDYQAAWRSSNAAVATVGDDGMVRAVGPGEATITATVSGQRGEFALRVRPPARPDVARVTISRQPSTLEVGQTHSVSATAMDAGERPLSDREIQWRSSDERIAAVAPDGTIQAKAAGRVTITATAEGKSQQFTLDVTAPPAPVDVTPVPPPTPTPVSPAVTVASIGLGAEVSCVTLADGSANCWGTPAPARVATTNLQRVVTGSAFACGLQGNGAVLCWGANRSGQLGNGETSNEPVTQPVRVATDQRFTRITAGAEHACGVAVDGKAWCWGKNNDGQLGNGSTRDQSAPVAVERGFSYGELAAGEKHTCGVTTEGKVLCWGDGFSDQLGLGVQDQRRQPDDVPIRQPMSVIAAGRYANCATGPDHITYCWGRGFTSTPRQVPTDLQFSQLAVGDEFACGLVSGAAWCWGKNNRGQLGDGSGRNQNAPVKVATSQTFTLIAAGNAHACAVTSAGATFCWGDNGKGQVGAGEDRSPVPVEIRR